METEAPPPQPAEIKPEDSQSNGHAPPPANPEGPVDVSATEEMHVDDVAANEAMDIDKAPAVNGENLTSPASVLRLGPIGVRSLLEVRWVPGGGGGG